jgi:hypothetical protein
MASHNEIKVGDTCWVIRIAGEDVKVKVMEKNPKASGRGYDFRVRRIGASGRVEGRNLTRGSGALRKPGTPVKGFGGAAPKRKPPARKKAAPKVKSNRPKPAPRASKPTPYAPAPAAPKRAPLSSLRGRKKAAPPAPKPAPAPARRGKETIQFRVPNDLIKKVMRKLSALKKEAGSYEVRNVVASVLAEHERSKYHYPAYRR